MIISKSLNVIARIIKILISLQFLHSQFVALSKREPQVLNQKASHDFESLKTTF